MRISFASATVIAALFTLPVLVASPAQAGIEACGNIDVEAHGMCELKVDACEVNCSPLNVQAACAAKLEGTCSATCPKTPSLTCTGSCQADCQARMWTRTASASR